MFTILTQIININLLIYILNRPFSRYRHILGNQANTPKVHNFTTVRTVRLHNAVGGLITLIRDNITFTTTYIPPTINTYNTTLQIVKGYTLTALNTSPLQKCIYLLETAHPCTTKQFTRTYNTVYSTSQIYHIQSPPDM